MKKSVATLIFAAAAIVGTPAMAQSASGTVVVNGTVAAKCSATDPISGTINLGELAKADGTVDKAFAGATNGLSRNFTVRCNGTNPNLSVEARSLVNTAATNSPNGYTNTVDYSAKLAAKGAKGTTTAITDLSLNSGATTGRIGDRLAAEANNVTLTILDGITSNSTAILEAGSYTGSVDIIITAAP
ncbi:hypothetical protein KK137_01665 [Croceibacterium sp. LX-88]|jgi:hypothetical protein|uniref:Spore coat protein U domain-containing protein n=1 Tax=Croceibacterium selenioxidans TaxID=2838833 RepID=A0ABS5W135_9SPHN|nr:hypothetical protein [Croceibacterium selenioxidans]MBT2133027.1 hypothetical protein [Croceibacterium selenioxidans]